MAASGLRKIMINEALSYKAWADKRTLQAVKKVDESLNAASYAFMLQQINHMVIVEDLFRSRLLNKPPPHSDTNSIVVPDFARLESRLITSNEWYLNYVTTLSVEKFRDVISFVFADGKSGSMNIEEILFHIVNHGSYHRGSIAHALDLAGVAHPTDGYGIYIHEKSPERRNET